MPNASLAARIATIRRRLSLTQGAFAQRVGVTRNIVNRWEGGHHRPSARALERVAAGVTVDWLLRGDAGLEEAVEPLRVAWREPGRRARVLPAG